MSENVSRYISFRSAQVICQKRLDACARIGVGIRRHADTTHVCPLCGGTLEYLISIPLRLLTHRERDIYDINWCSTHRCPRRFEGSGTPHFIKRDRIEVSQNAVKFCITSAGYEQVDDDSPPMNSKLGGFAHGTAEDTVTEHPVLASIECPDLLSSTTFPGHAALIVTLEHDQFVYHMQL